MFFFLLLYVWILHFHEFLVCHSYYFSTLFINNVHLSVTTEWRGPPVEQHSMSSAHGGVSRQCGAETFLSIYARTYVVATKSPERSRIYQDVTRTECIGCHDGAGLFCKTHYRGQKSWMTWHDNAPPHISCKFKVHIPLFGFKEQGSTSCLWGDSQSALILQECPKAWGPASTSPESHRKSSPRFPLKFPQRPQVCPAHLGLSCIKTSGDITRGCPWF